MNFPKPLKKGDTILLIAPSSPLKEITAEECAMGLKKLGFNVRLGKSVHGSTQRGYASAPAKVRADDINYGFSCDEIDVIWAVRGGSMACEVLPYLDYDMIKKHPKPLLGYSDITALHAVLQGKCQMVSYHAPIALSFANDGLDEYSWNAINRAFDFGKSFVFENISGKEINVLKDGVAEGILVGGNLSLVESLTGTEYAIDTQDKILFLEDIDEDVYKLNRMLVHLDQCGMFKKARGVIFGGLTNSINEYNESFTPDDMVKEFFENYDKPVYTNLSVGHIPDNGTLPLGAMCRMEGGKITFFS